MDFAGDTDALCDLMLRIVAQIKTHRVQVATSSVNMTRTDEGVIYGITIDLEPEEGNRDPERPGWFKSADQAYGLERDRDGSGVHLYPIGGSE